MVASAQSSPPPISSAHELVLAIEDDVRAGRRSAGDRLPSVRALAASAGLSPTTVTAAVAELRRRGVVVTRDRSGTVIAGPSLGAPPDAYLPDGAVDLLHGGPDPALLPDLGAALAAVAAELAGRHERDPYRTEPVHAGLQRWWDAHIPTGGSPDVATAATSGAFDAVERTLSATMRHGDRVGVEDPGYPPVMRVMHALGLVPVPMEVDDDGPTIESVRTALRTGVRGIIVTPKGQNPTGARLTDERADDLRMLLAGHPDALVVEDDHLGLLGPAVPTVTGTTMRWMHARSVSKALGPDLRLALVAGDATTMRDVASRLRAGPGWVSHLLQGAASALLESPSTATVLDDAARTYDARRAALLAALAARGVPANGASGLCVWIPVRAETAVCLALAERGYAVAPGASFRLSSGPGIRVTTSRMSLADAGTVAAAISDAIAVAG